MSEREREGEVGWGNISCNCSFFDSIYFPVVSVELLADYILSGLESLKQDVERVAHNKTVRFSVLCACMYANYY